MGKEPYHHCQYYCQFESLKHATRYSCRCRWKLLAAQLIACKPTEILSELSFRLIQ